MPYQNVPDELQDKMESCIQTVMDKGQDKEAAIAICYASVVEGKSDLSVFLGEIKAGRRNNADDRQRIREIRKAVETVRDITLEMEPDDEDEGDYDADQAIDSEETEIDEENTQNEYNRVQGVLASRKKSVETISQGEETYVIMGGTVKALDEAGKIGGYLVTFGNPQKTDLEGEFFTSETDFGEIKTSPVYYHHGLDAKIGKRVIGRGEVVRADEVGLWFEAQLNTSDDYEKAIFELVKRGKLGWSSGTAGHLGERESKGGAVWIRRWPLGLDASLTPTPAEPQNRAMALKSIVPNAGDLEGRETARAGDAAAESQTDQGDFHSTLPNGDNTMFTPEQKAELTQLMAESIKAALPAEEPKPQGAAMTSAPAIKRSTRLGFSNEDVQGFMHWLKTGDKSAVKAAWQEDTDSEGGYLVPDDFYSQIVAKRDIASWVRNVPVTTIQTMLDKVNVPTESTAATKFVVTAEEGSYDENEPVFGNVGIEVHKLTKLIKLSEELADDSRVNLTSYLSDVFGRSLAAGENYYFTVGTGTNMPKGVLTDATAGNTTSGSVAIAAGEIPTLIGKLGGGYNVPSQCFFLMRNATYWYLNGLTGNPFQFYPTTQQINDFRLMGYKVAISDDMEVYSTASKKPIIFGNASMYAVVERAGMSVMRNPYLYMATGQIGVFAKVRLGGAVLQADAFYYLLMAAS